nr:hypothetical protein [Tanacetum cinerariifolium]
TVSTHDDEAGSSLIKRSCQYETMEEAMLPRVHHEFLTWGTCPGVLNKMGCTEEIESMLEIKVYEAGSQEEILSSKARRRVFDINKPIYTELCHEFYSTYDFDEVCADDKLRTKKLIKFRLCGRAHSLTFLEFTRRLGLYHSEEVNEEGFDVYFQGESYFDGATKDDHLWLVPKDDWRKGVGSQKDSMICCGQLITKIAKKMGLLTDEVLNSLSAPTYCRALDTTTLRELIDFKGRLIPEDPALGVPRVAIPRGPKPSMQDLYDHMGSMEIR